MKNPKAKGGFTLLELLVVVIIVGILASIAIPQFAKTMEQGRVAEAKSILGAIRTAEAAYYQEHLIYLDATNTANPLAVDIPLDASTEHYFTYKVAAENKGANFTATATRKVSGDTGKSPLWTGKVGYTVTLTDKGALDASGP